MRPNIFVKKMALSLSFILFFTQITSCTKKSTNSSDSTIHYSNGTLDLTFGSQGIVQTDIFTNSDDFANGLAIQSTGKLIALLSAQGSSIANHNIVLIRYKSDGTIDPTFGTSGKVDYDLGVGTMDYGNGIFVDSQDRILVVGTTRSPGGNSGYDSFIARFNPNGSIDPTFGTTSGSTGVTIVDTRSLDNTATSLVGFLNDFFKSVVVSQNGSIYVSGETLRRGDDYSPARPSPFTSDLVVAKFDTNGALVTSFGAQGVGAASQGVAVFDSGSFEEEWDSRIALNSREEILVVAKRYTPSTSTWNSVVLKIDSTGSLVSSFGSNGIKIVDFGLNKDDEPSHLAIQSDDKIVVAGRARNSSDGDDFSLFRLTDTGSLDSAFGTGGRVMTDLGSTNSNEMARRVFIQNDGKIIVGGERNFNAKRSFAVARYLPSGILDSSFGNQGFSTTEVSSSLDLMVTKGMVVQADGKIVLIGDAHDPSTATNSPIANAVRDIGLVRYGR